MLSAITGTINRVLADAVRIQAGPFEYEVLVPELVVRQLHGNTGQQVTLHTSHYLEGSPMQGRLVPRLIGFGTEAEREFFELLCAVEGVNVRKALKAMSRPVTEIADAIQRVDRRMLEELPGIGKATAEKIINTLRNKVTKFALMRKGAELPPEQPTAPDVWDLAYEALRSVGHTAEEARQLLEKARQSGRHYETPEEVLLAIYAQKT